MMFFRKVWTKEIHEWLLEHKAVNRKELYQMFIDKFKIYDVTFVAFCNQRSRIGATNYHTNHGSTIAKPIGYESQKKGYVRIKVAQPNVWMFKNVYVWNQTHPNDLVKPKKELVIFLNGNKRDFRPENLYKMPRTIISIFNNLGGIENDNPEITLLRVKQAQVKHEFFNRARELGLIRSNGRFLEDCRDYYYKRKSAMTPEEKEQERIKVNRRAKERRDKMRLENPEAYQEVLRKKRELRKRQKQKKLYDKKNGRRQSDIIEVAR